MKKRRLISDIALADYKRKQKFTLTKHLAKLDKLKHQGGLYELYMSESSVYSSQIEGSTVSESDYIRFLEQGVGKGTDRIQEVADLHAAYRFARENDLTEANVLKAHKLSTATILKHQDEFRGKLRTVNVRVGNMFVTVYNCPPPDVVKTDFPEFMNEVSALCNMKLSLTEVFYYASMIHLAYVKIHPFADGNGRTARLLEKWFLARQLGAKAWFIRSEKYYKERQPDYYANLRLIGASYDALQYENSVPFLLMLPWALRLSH